MATREADVGALESLAARARDNGVEGLQRLTRAQAVALEPELTCQAALLSPGSGIVDSHGLMTSLLADAQAAGALLAVTSGVAGAARHGGVWCVREKRRGDAPASRARSEPPRFAPARRRFSYAVSGDVRIRISTQRGDMAVLSALAFDELT